MKHFNISEKDFLGEGGESFVYQLNDSKIIRIYKDGDKFQVAYVRRLKAFYDSLRSENLSLTMPSIEEINQYEGIHYSIEPRIHGCSLSDYLKNNQNCNLSSVLKSYLDAAAQIHHLTYDSNDYFGEILANNPQRKNSWSDFLIARTNDVLSLSLPYLKKDVGKIDQLIKNWQEAVRQLDEPETNLVHGDFFPGNVLVDKNGQTIAVLDFSPLTLLGDWRMDIVGAHIYLEVIEAHSEEQTLISRDIIKRKYSENIDDKLIDIYRVYYALYFSFVITENDHGLYKWCVNSLKNSLLNDFP